ncbi:putative membrane protein [Waddlia chondrophila 2032/99]|nr:putative membrane protein [Waddlia chondrophila 2032/99]
MSDKKEHEEEIIVEKETKEESGKKFSETIENLKKNKNIESILEYARNNTKDTVAFVLLIIGILWMLGQPFNGGILVGLVVGFYFSKEFISYVKDFNSHLEEQGLAKTVILGGGALALFFLAPGIFIGVAVMAALKYLLKSE